MIKTVMYISCSLFKKYFSVKIYFLRNEHGVYISSDNSGAPGWCLFLTPWEKGLFIVRIFDCDRMAFLLLVGNGWCLEHITGCRICLYSPSRYTQLAISCLPKSAGICYLKTSVMHCLEERNTFNRGPHSVCYPQRFPVSDDRVCWCVR